MPTFFLSLPLSWGQFHQHLRAAFTYVSCAGSFFSAYVLGLYFIGAKAVHRTLVKLTPDDDDDIRNALAARHLHQKELRNRFNQTLFCNCNEDLQVIDQYDLLIMISFLRVF
jgi:hypothetical protein